MNIGQKVKALKDRKNLSNSDFARLLGMTESNLFSIYKREHTTTDVVEKIMKATGVPSSYFFDDKAIINISQQGTVNALGENKVNYTTSKTEAENVEIAVLRVQLESRDKEIEYLKQIIEMLKAGK
jgi:transcriptional regulator with XRE-family HTH domain